MTYQPPFTITTEVIDLISAVSEQVGFVQRYFLDASVNALQNAPVNIKDMKTPDAIIALLQADNAGHWEVL